MYRQYPQFLNEARNYSFAIPLQQQTFFQEKLFKYHSGHLFTQSQWVLPVTQNLWKAQRNTLELYGGFFSTTSCWTNTRKTATHSKMFRNFSPNRLWSKLKFNTFSHLKIGLRWLETLRNRWNGEKNYWQITIFLLFELKTYSAIESCSFCLPQRH